MLKYIFLFIVFLFILFLLVNYGKMKTIIEKQGLADINSDYIPPEIIPNIITEKQNRDIIEYASTRFSPSVVGGGFTNVVDSTVRKSQTAWMSKENPIIRDLIEGICNKHNLKFENCEDMQIVKYEKDNYYKEHHDSFPFYEPDFISQGGHRVLTTLIYLNEDFEGGETWFPALKLTVKPRRNSAVVFHPLDSKNIRCHPKALHGGNPVKSGIKYICNIWIREGPYQYEIEPWNYDYLFNSTLLFFYRTIINK
jgi:prolyl 4-hydroxylase